MYACVALCLDAATDFSCSTLLIYKNCMFGFGFAVAVDSRIFVSIFRELHADIFIFVVT